jgi:hypothetical protein
MTINISFQSSSGRTLKATLQRLSDGKYWDNNVDAAWETAPTWAEVAIALTEDSGRNAGTYRGTSAGNVGAADILVRIHDDNDANDAAIGCQQIATNSSGNEILLSGVYNAGTLATLDALLAQLATDHGAGSWKAADVWSGFVMPPGFYQSINAIGYGTIGTGSTNSSLVTSSVTPAHSASAPDQFKGRVVIFSALTTTVALRGQAAEILASSAAATPVLTVTALTATPVAGDIFSIV